MAVRGTAGAHFDTSVPPAHAGLVPGVDLFDVVWSKSDVVAVEILRSSSFLRELQSGHVTQSCFSRFMQQEALYMSRVGSTLEVRRSPSS